MRPDIGPTYIIDFTAITMVAIRGTPGGKIKRDTRKISRKENERIGLEFEPDSEKGNTSHLVNNCSKHEEN